MSYELLKEMERKYLESSADLIARVNKEAKDTVFPQNILVYKMATDAVSNAEDDSVCKRIDDRFYFTEKLVNRLMLLAYYEGTRAIEDNSYRKGVADANAKTAEAVRAFVANLGVDVYPEDD